MRSLISNQKMELLSKDYFCKVADGILIKIYLMNQIPKFCIPNAHGYS